MADETNFKDFSKKVLREFKSQNPHDASRGLSKEGKSTKKSVKLPSFRDDRPGTKTSTFVNPTNISINVSQ